MCEVRELVWGEAYGSGMEQVDEEGVCFVEAGGGRAK